MCIFFVCFFGHPFWLLCGPGLNQIDARKNSKVRKLKMKHEINEEDDIQSLLVLIFYHISFFSRK